MRISDQVDTVQEMDLLVGFFDLANFARYARNLPPLELFTTISAYYEFVGHLIEAAGGEVVKFVGDAALIIFAEADVNAGVLALKALQEQGDAWLAERQIKSRHIIKAHFGPVACGPVGTATDKRFDVFGQTVNTAALLKSNGLAITPQVFRKLPAETRQLFKKHTPPITYISVSEPHRD